MRMIYLNGTTIHCKTEETYQHLQRILLSSYFKTLKIKSNADNSKFPVIRNPNYKPDSDNIFNFLFQNSRKNF